MIDFLLPTNWNMQLVYTERVIVTQHQTVQIEHIEFVQTDARPVMCRLDNHPKGKQANGEARLCAVFIDFDRQLKRCRKKISHSPMKRMC